MCFQCLTPVTGSCYVVKLPERLLWCVVCTYKRQPRRKKSRVPVPHVEDVIGFATERLGFEPDERQRELLGSLAKRGILNCSRQWGQVDTGGDQGGPSGLQQAGERGAGRPAPANARARSS